ncbi:rubredoxin [Vibrio lentus]|nr:rubredoxin [Vibrio lentus]
MRSYTCWRYTSYANGVRPNWANPYQGVEPGTPWTQVPDDFLCPAGAVGQRSVCGEVACRTLLLWVAVSLPYKPSRWYDKSDQISQLL